MQQSRSDSGFILIETDKNAYYPGDVVAATIYLQVNSGQVNGNKLFLKVQGLEKVATQKEGSRFQDEGHRTIYDREKEVHDFNSMYLPQGQFEYKVELDLGDDIPGSIELIENQQNFSCQIQYKLIAVIKDYQQNETLLKKEYIVLIKEQSTEEKYKLRERMQPEIQEWCFLNKGHPIVTAEIDHSFFEVGQTCTVTVQLNNANCGKDIRRVYVKLINLISLRLVNGSQKKTKRTVIQQQQPGMKSSTDTRQPYIFEIQLQDSTQDQLYGNVNGQLIQSSYEIDVSIEISINCFTLLNPSIQLPILIASKEPQKKVIKPPGWPKQEDYKILIFNLAEQEQKLQPDVPIDPIDPIDVKPPKNIEDDIMKCPMPFSSYKLKNIGGFNG